MPKTSHVYVLFHRSEPRLKIGKANTVSIRAHDVIGDDIDRARSYFIGVRSARAAHKLESSLHYAFSAWRIDGLPQNLDGRTEWFSTLCSVRLRDYIEANLDLFRGVIFDGVTQPSTTTRPVSHCMPSLSFVSKRTNGFSTKLLFVPKHDFAFSKPAELLAMEVVSGEFGKVSRKLYNRLLQLSAKRCHELMLAGVAPTVDVIHESTLSSLVAHMPGKPSQWSSTATRHLKELQFTQVVWISTGGDAAKAGLGVANLLSMVEVIQGGKGIPSRVRWKLPQNVLESLINPSTLASLDLSVMGSLRSYAAIALYEFCSLYKKNKSMRTCAKPPEWWVSVISPRGARTKSRNPCCEEPGSHTMPSTSREWRKLKFDAVMDAVSEINMKTDLLVELQESRLGKSVFEVQFVVTRKQMLQTESCATSDTAANIDTRHESTEGGSTYSLEKKHVESLGRPEQEGLAAVALERLKALGMATPAILRAYENHLAGGPLTGVLLGEVTRQHLATLSTTS